MAVFSDVDIRAALEKGIISIEGFDTERLGNDSYNLQLGKIWEVTGPGLRELILETQRRLGVRGLDTEYKLPDVSRRHRGRSKGTLNPKKVYVAECPKIEVREGVKARIIPRSGAARNAVHAFNPSPNGWVFVVPYAFTEMAGDAAQLLLFEEGTKELSFKQMRDAYEKEELFFSDPRFLSRGVGGYATMHFSREIVGYRGGRLGKGDNASKFAKNRRNNMFEFYLGITKEEFGTGRSIILWMQSDQGNLYPNAPLCHANVEPQQHTLEVLLSPEEVVRIRDGQRLRYACSVRAYPLRTPTSTPYNGKCNNQIEPLPKV